jgi:hypothetical protein
MRLGVHALLCAALGAQAGCTPDVGDDPVPEALEFDLAATPPRVPQPTSLIVDPRSGRIDFSLAGLDLPEDCGDQRVLPEAECEFDHYLESLDGFPTLSAAQAPATAEIDLSTLEVGDDLVIVAARSRQPVSDIAVDFDDESQSLVIRKEGGWDIGEFYWLGVRGYANGVRARGGSEVVGSPTSFLLKQDASLTCGARSPGEISDDCPALALVSRGRSPAEARGALFQLEAVRTGYDDGGGFALMQALGLPKSEIAVLWGFPIHGASVAELDPSAGVVPRVSPAGQLLIDVKGDVDPATLTAIAPGVPGSIALVDLTAALAGDLAGALVTVEPSFEMGSIALGLGAALDPEHTYGVFITRAVTDIRGAPLVPSPVSKLLTLRAELTDASGKSQVSSVSDAQAAALEQGRAALAALFDDPLVMAATGITREELVYCFAFQPGGAP